MGPTYHFLKHLPALKVKVNVTQLCPTLCNPMDYTIHGIFQARILEWMPFPSPGDLPNPGVEPRSPTLQADSLPAEPQGKPKNTGVGSLSLLQGIFPTQESNRGLLHCRQILYQLSYHRSPASPGGGILEKKIKLTNQQQWEWTKIIKIREEGRSSNCYYRNRKTDKRLLWIFIHKQTGQLRRDEWTPWNVKSSKTELWRNRKCE